MLVLNVFRIQIVAILVVKLPPQPTVRDHHSLPPSSPHHQCLPMIPTALTKLMFVKAIALFAEDVGVAIMLPELIGDPKGQVNEYHQIPPPMDTSAAEVIHEKQIKYLRIHIIHVLIKYLRPCG